MFTDAQANTVMYRHGYILQQDIPEMMEYKVYRKNGLRVTTWRRGSGLMCVLKARGFKKKSAHCHTLAQFVAMFIMYRKGFVKQVEFPGMLGYKAFANNDLQIITYRCQNGNRCVFKWNDGTRKSVVYASLDVEQFLKHV